MLCSYLNYCFIPKSRGYSCLSHFISLGSAFESIYLTIQCMCYRRPSSVLSSTGSFAALYLLIQPTVFHVHCSTATTTLPFLVLLSSLPVLSSVASIIIDCGLLHSPSPSPHEGLSLATNYSDVVGVSMQAAGPMMPVPGRDSRTWGT